MGEKPYSFCLVNTVSVWWTTTALHRGWTAGRGRHTRIYAWSTVQLRVTCPLISLSSQQNTGCHGRSGPSPDQPNPTSIDHRETLWLYSTLVMTLCPPVTSERAASATLILYVIYPAPTGRILSPLSSQSAWGKTGAFWLRNSYNKELYIHFTIKSSYYGVVVCASIWCLCTLMCTCVTIRQFICVLNKKNAI
jgi:hypothetical protein